MVLANNDSTITLWIQFMLTLRCSLYISKILDSSLLEVMESAFPVNYAFFCHCHCLSSHRVLDCVCLWLCHALWLFLCLLSVYLDKLLKYWYPYFREHGLNTPPTLPAITQSKQTEDSKEQSNSHGPSLPRTFVHCNTYNTYFLSRKLLKKPSSNSCSSRADINEYYLLVPLVLQNYQSKFCTNPIFL